MSHTHRERPAPRSAWFGVRRTVPLALALAAFSACADSGADTPLGPPSGAREAGAPQERPFYYHQGQPVYLEIDPGRMVVSTTDRAPADVARQVLASLGVGVSDAGALPQLPGHRVLRLSGSSPAQARRAEALLKADSRFTFAAPAYRTAQGGDDVLLLNRVAVQFREGVSRAQIDELVRGVGARIIREPKPDSGFFAHHLAYPSGPQADPLRIAATLDRSPLVAWADPDKVSDRRPLYIPTDPFYGQQWHLYQFYSRNWVRVDLNVERVWNVTKGSRSIRVAVIDDGVDWNHPDLRGALSSSQGFDLLYDPARPNEHAHAPCCNDTHGTSIAGIIAADQDNGQGGSGIAPGVLLNTVRIFRQTYPPQNNTQVASDVQIGDGINWAWQHAASDVLNNSWGGGAPSNAITTAINNALTLGRGGRGAVVVFGAGNTSNRRGGFIGGVLYPASLPDVISVGAIDWYGDLTNYTPEGARIDVVGLSGHDTGYCIGALVTVDRPGTAGCNDGPNGDINYTRTFSGTSGAAPQASAIAALLLSREPGLTAAQVRARIRGGAYPWGPATQFGAGKLDAAATLGL